MKYSTSEFNEILDDIESVIEFIYYPKKSHKKVEKTVKGIRKKVNEEGLNSILSCEKVRL